ncbi:hypothetical protein YC2023_002026 [Brassica napus]
MCSGAGGEDDADMHKHHGFFVPNVEYLKDPEGFSLTSVLSELCHAFSSLEAVRKSHCELHYGSWSSWGYRRVIMSRWRQIQMRNWLMRKKKRPQILCLSECARELVEKMMQTCTSTMGCKIHASCKRTYMESKGRLLPVGAWRHIQNFTLSPSTGMYRATDHPFKMSIIQNTAITRSPLINEDMFLSLVDFQTVLGGSLKTCFLIDVIGQVVDLGDLETIQVSGKPRMKIEFTLRDMNDARVPCCLWGKFAEILYEGCSKDEEGKPICLIRFVDEVKPLAICEGRDEILDLEEVKSIQDKRDKWMLFPKRTIHGLLESTQLRQFMERRSLHISGGVRCAKRMFQVCHQANVESSESDQDLALTSGEEV